MRKEAILDVERIELENIEPDAQARLEEVARIVFEDYSIFYMVEDEVRARLKSGGYYSKPRPLGDLFRRNGLL